MKSVQELRVDSNKHQLLETRINPIRNNLDDGNDMNNFNGLNDNNATERSNSMENSKQEDNSSSSNYVVNNSIVNSVAESGISNAVSLSVVNAVRPDVQNDSYSSPNRQQNIANKRKRKSKVESPCIKKICNRPDKKIDELFRSVTNLKNSAPNLPILPISENVIISSLQNNQNALQNSCSDNSLESQDYLAQMNPANNPNQTAAQNILSEIDAASIGNNIASNISPGSIATPVTTIVNNSTNIAGSNNGNNSTQSLSQGIHISTDNLIIELRRKIDELEQTLFDKTSELKKSKETIKQSREALIKSLIAQTELERRESREKNSRNCIELGSFRSVRQGAHVEEKWVPGHNYIDLEQRREKLESDRELFEKERKQHNRNARKSKGNDLNQSSIEVQLQADEFESRRNALNKKEKELQEIGERYDRERVLHIRETKRIAHEEASRFRRFPILNERYLMLSLLGRGGFSEVFRAYDLDKFDWVACKVHELNSQWPQEKKDSYVRHALREIEIHKQLCHPRIVRVLDVFNIDSDAFCTVQEYCQGNDLDFFLKQQTPRCSLPEKESKYIISQVVSALRYLNDRRNPIIHYDLKPGNILLCRRDCGSSEIKITDFGLSKIFPDDNGLTDPDEGMELTSQGAGTYWYLPPECFVTETGRPPTISSKVDVWSVGVIFYQCLYGKKPFGDNETQTDILHNNTILQARSINFPSNPKVSDSAKDFIRKCCTYRKELRPDVFQLYTDDYLKPKNQLKYGVDVSLLPGPGPSNNNTNSNSTT